MTMRAATPTAQLHPPRTLREAIARSHLTNQQIIAKVGCTKKSLTNWRNGKRPNDFYIGQLSTVLGVNLWPLYDAKQQPEVDHDLPQLPATPAPASMPTLQSSGTFPQLSGAVVLLRTSAQPIVGLHTIDLAMRRYVGEQRQHLWDQFHLTEEPTGVATLQIATASHLQLLEALGQRQVGDGDRLWLLQSLSEAALLVGRVARDQLDYHEAIAQTKRALDLALESASSDHVAAATMRLAETLWEAGLPYDALGYCAAGMEQAARAGPRIRGELMGFAAEVYGSLGFVRDSERFVNAAAELAVGAAQLPTVGGINFSETAAAEYQTYEALRRRDLAAALAHVQRARQLLYAEFPSGHNVRWEAHLWMAEARVHADAGDLEAACYNLRHAAQLAQSITSRITMRKVQEAARDLAGTCRAPNRALSELTDELIRLFMSGAKS